MFDLIVVEFNLIERSYKQIPFSEIDLASSDLNRIYWIHCDLNKHDLFQQVKDVCELPEELLQLIEKEDAIATLVDRKDSLSMRIQCPLAIALDHAHHADFGNIIIHLTTKYCLTFSYDHIPAIKTLLDNFHLAIMYAETPCFILFLLMDDIINDYSTILFDFELLVEKIDIPTQGLEKNLYNEVMDIKKQVMTVKRHTSAIRNILMRISGRKIAVISEQCRLSLSNLFNHSLMIVDEADAIRDILNGTLDQIENMLMHRMSESMKVLTAFAAIFLPLSLIAGIYGMNFHWIPELEWQYGYFWALFLMVVITGGLIYIFKKKDWF